VKPLDLHFTSALMDDEFGVKKIAPFQASIRSGRWSRYQFNNKEGGKGQSSIELKVSSKR